MANSEPITIKTVVDAPVEKVWKYFTLPAHITKWNNAGDDWHSPRAENDFKPGGKFSYRMESRDGSQGFDFTGKYTTIITGKLIEYLIDDGRKVTVNFADLKGGQTEIIETFEPENENPLEMQRSGWQAILDNFKKYTEKN